jgi:Arc/MetJ-type ribon-helix-helix transcriptional regulator
MTSIGASLHLLSDNIRLKDVDLSTKGGNMETQRVTVRLPSHQVRAMDTFIKLGEFTSRSEVMRAAISRFIDDVTEELFEKAERLKKIQQLEARTSELEKYWKK